MSILFQNQVNVNRQKSHLLVYLGMTLLVFLIFLTLPCPEFNKASVPLRIGLVSLGGLCLIWDERLRKACLDSWPMCWLWIFTGLAGLSLLWNGFPPNGLRQLGLAVAIFMGYAIYCYYSPRFFDVPWLVAGVSLVSVASFWLIFGENGLGWIANTAWIGSRFGGYPGQHPATFGWMCAMLSLISFNAGIRSKHFKWYWLILTSLLLFYLLISWSRVYIIIAFSLIGLRLLMLLLQNFSWITLRRYGIGLSLLILFGGILGTLAWFFDFISLRLDLLSNNTLESRTYIWQSAWQAFLDQPWLGHGMNSTRIYFAEYIKGLPLEVAANAQFLEASTTHAHNFVLHFLAEDGVLGFLAISMLIISCLWQGTEVRWILLGILGTSILDLFMGAREHSTLSFAVFGAAAMLPMTRSGETGSLSYKQ